MLRLAILLVAAFATAAGAAESQKDKATVILSDPQQGRTMGKIDGETILLQKTPAGTIGKMGKDKVILHKDGQGNTLGKVGNQKVFCHSDPVTGLTICK